MKLRTSSGERFRIGVVTFAALLLGIVAWRLIGEAALIMVPVVCLAIVMLMQMELASLLREQVRHELLFDFSWTAEFPSIASEFLPVEKGAFLLRKGESSDLAHGAQVTTFR